MDYLNPNYCSDATLPKVMYGKGLQIWLSVESMSDKYQSTSPYAYYRNNPAILVDPDEE